MYDDEWPGDKPTLILYEGLWWKFVVSKASNHSYYVWKRKPK